MAKKQLVVKSSASKKADKAVNSTPTPTAKVERVASPATGTVPKAKTPTASIHRGLTTGLPVMKFQDQQLAAQPKTKLSDEALLEAMKKEFPQSRGLIFTGTMEQRLTIMRAVRHLFNEKRHGHQTIMPPDGGVKRYNDKGEVIAEVGRRSTKPVAVAPVAAEPAKSKAVAKLRKTA